jgi:tetratricopeptide (TPR) repeat protein
MTSDAEDRRTFKRYKKDTAFKLKLDTGMYNCKMVDYSADGISLHILEDRFSLEPGQVVELSVEDPEIDFFGEIVWTKKAASGYIVGFKRIGSIKGSCQDFRMSDILIGLQRSTKTGILEVIRGQKITRIFIKNGDVIFANSNREDDRFGEVLLKQGVITLEQFFEVSERLKNSDKRLGQILVEYGYLKPPELFRAVRYQVEEIIVNMLTDECGRFQFSDGPLPTEETIILNLSAANLIYNGIKRSYNFQNILDDFPSLDTVLSLSYDPMDLFQDILLNDDDKNILSCIDGKARIKDILSSSPLNNFETMKTVYALLSAKIIVVRRDIAPPPVSAEEVIIEHYAEIDPEFLKKIEELYEAHKSLGYYETLGVHKNASDQEIKKAFFSKAKEFHPDRHFALQSHDLKGKLNEIFSHITEAYHTLINAKKRREYDELASRKPFMRASNTELAHERFTEGRARLLSDNLQEAEKLFAEAVYLDGSQPSYYYYHGLTLSRLKDFRRSVDVINKAIELNPDESDYFAELGHVFIKLGFTQRAKTAFEKALALMPSCERALEGKRILENL